MPRQYFPQFSRPFAERFWTRPWDAVPFILGSSNVQSLNNGTETGVLIEDDVPDTVNGFRIDSLIISGAVQTVPYTIGGVKVRLYVGDIRNPAGPTFNVPTFYELSLMVGLVPFAYPVAWFVNAGRHWQATYINTSGATLNQSGIVLTGWFF